MQHSNLVVQTENLTKVFDDVAVVNSLNLEVPKHSIVGFLGPNGAGKSTTIKLLLGLIKPTSGSGTVFGLDIVKDSNTIRQRIGYLAQKPSYYPKMTAREILHFVARFFYSDPTLIKERVEEALELVGLESKADRAIKGFSGGELQRLGIAQAQINRPDLLILDEPAAALDPMGRADVLHIMERLRHHATIFYSTHILDDVQRVSDRVVILNHGQMVAQGPIEQMLSAEDTISYELEVEGHTDATIRRVEAQSWVTGVRTVNHNGVDRWTVSVSDEGAANSQLLRLFLEEDAVNVLSFSRQQFELEDVFMQLVGAN